jgi:chromate transporter
VGVIASLALFFIAHVAHFTGANDLFSTQIDFVALILATLAGVALMRFKVGVVPVIAACAVAGLVARLAFP